MADDNQRRVIQATVSNAHVLELALDHLTTKTTLPKTLHDIAQGAFASDQELDRKGRKILGVLLAWSLLQLCGSPWLQYAFEQENIFVLPKQTSFGLFDHWRPHISCDLSISPTPRSLSDDVAALGVLILELEANKLAGWTEGDQDYEMETRSNKTRLSRVLRDWKGNLTDSYWGVGLACSRFENLVETFDHPEIDESLRSLAILYKCIINPLFEVMVSDFGETALLFEGNPGLSVPTSQNQITGSEVLELFDHLDSTAEDHKSKYAKEFMKTLADEVLSRISVLRKKTFARITRGIKQPDKIRIAVLDTGVDKTDLMIKAALKTLRIRKALSWVEAPNKEELSRNGPSEICEDKYGHGTHVTRLLLQVAPAAEIYVAKICHEKSINRKDLWRIAEAIDWARKKWDVHIISMSFGFEGRDEGDAIGIAIDQVSRANKLMFAAASNQGGNRGRSRPALDRKVICIHACDGNGNKGDMSPTPEAKTVNFTTLGVAVESKWKAKTVYKSGTSFDTPIAAAIAADVLEFANHKCKLDERLQRLLYTKDGMQGILLEAMSNERDGYDYVQPGGLWGGRKNKEVADKIWKILDQK